ncbi:biopolymer transporter ExbD [Thiomicrorhabdus sp.]|uniref:ExbD/TolR family protein n=1 Tax=Thiomicrorhabdus sp. TaxID=2039724 RepID=UPI002AA65D44|nr:biopolymer transporter ExbD [Thiomicrorhabdus sp.]
MDFKLIERRRPDPEDSLIPLINIVFLLLIFFMVAGQISATETQDIEPPTSSSETPLDRDGWVIQINAQQEILLNDEPIVLAELVKDDMPLEQVIIKADQNTTAKTLHPVLQTLREQGVKNILLYSQLQDSE